MHENYYQQNSMITSKACQRHNPLWQAARAIQHARSDWWMLVACCLFLPLLFLPLHTQADTTLVLDGKISERQSLVNSLEYYEPGLQQPDITDIHQLKNQQWRHVKLLPASLVFQPRHNLWFRFRINNRSNTTQTLLLNDTNQTIDNQVVYVFNETGRFSSCVTLEGIGRSHVSAIELQSQSLATVYVKSTGFHSSFVSLSLMNPDYYRKMEYRNYMIAGIIDGVIISLTFYSLLLGIKTRQRMYFAFSLLGFFNLATIITQQNFLAMHVGLLNNEWRTNLSLFIPLVAYASLVHFVRDFLAVARYHPKIDKFMRVSIIIGPMVNVAFMLGTPMILTTPLYIALSTATTIAMFYACIDNREHQRTSKVMTATGIAMPVAYGIIATLASQGVEKTGNVYMEFVQVFIALEMMMFSLAMANKIREMQDKHQQQLMKVSEARIIGDAHNRLLSHLNHEMRTPLNGILGAAEILLQKSKSQNEPVFGMIYQTALPLKHLIDDMVNIRAITENPKNIEYIEFDLTALLQECMDIFLPVAHKKHIRLYITISDEIPGTVTGDPNRLRQILLNLIGNACKFTSEGEVGLHVRKLPDKSLYYFEICDTGAGISANDEARLFQSFETGITDTNPTGTGLGLSIVRELCELMHGECGYEKKSGANGAQGSKFWFSAMLENDSDHRARKVKSTNQVYGQSIFAEKSVLIADENYSICEHIRQLLSGKAAKITTVCHQEALYLAIRSGNHNGAIIHQSMLTDKIREALATTSTMYCPYIDQSESLYIEKADDTIIRGTASDTFLADITRHCFPTAKASTVEMAENNNHHNLNILVAEDIPINQQIIRELLESLSARMVMCNNGLEASRKFMEAHENSIPFDVIIMDCEMPVQDGFETTRQIRRYEQENSLVRTRIIALTAHTELSYRQRSIAAGMDVFLTKPVKTDILRECLGKRRNLL
jgi:signal transduction histidine kinase/CheY-like chemotaxis protein